MGSAKINLRCQLDGFGNRAVRDVSFIRSGMTLLAQAQGVIASAASALASTATVAILDQSLTSAYGVYIEYMSATTSNIDLYFYQSGLTFSNALILNQGQGVYVQFKARNCGLYAWASNKVYFSFAIFGK